MRSKQNKFKFTRLFILLLSLLAFNNAGAIPLPSETSDLVLVCRGYPHWPYYKSVDEDNAIIINYQINKIYWYGDITNKRLFNELHILDEKREHTFFGNHKEIIDIALAQPNTHVQEIGRITKSSHDKYISVTIGDYSFRAHCIFYSADEYNKNILPQFITRN